MSRALVRARHREWLRMRAMRQARAQMLDLALMSAQLQRAQSLAAGVAARDGAVPVMAGPTLQ